MNNFRFVGLTRFSVDPRSIINRQKRAINKRYIKELLYDLLYRPKADGRSLGQLANILYDKDRLSSRLKLFKSFPLASMAHLASNNNSVCYKVFYSSLLPQEIVSELHQITAAYSSWCECIAVRPSDSFFKACNQSIRKYTGSYIFTFRLDDDDALGSSYIKYILAAITLDNGKDVYSMPSGYTLARIGPDKFVLSSKEQFKIALGLGRLAPVLKPSTIFDEEYLHGLIPDPKVHKLTTPPIWIRTVHDTNDSIPSLSVTNTLSADEVTRKLGSDFVPIINKISLMNLPLIDMVPDQSKRKLLYFHQ
jgi:hypothetical protein